MVCPSIFNIAKYILLASFKIHWIWKYTFNYFNQLLNLSTSTTPPKLGMYTLASTLYKSQFDEDDESGPLNSFRCLSLIFVFYLATNNLANQDKSLSIVKNLISKLTYIMVQIRNYGSSESTININLHLQSISGFSIINYQFWDLLPNIKTNIIGGLKYKTYYPQNLHTYVVIPHDP